MLHCHAPCFSVPKTGRGATVTPRVVSTPRVCSRLTSAQPQPVVRCSAVYNRSGSFGPDDAPIKWPPESEEVTALRKSLFALENERDDVVRIGEAAARSSVQLSEDVTKWNDVAVQRLQRNDDQGARNALREKATCSENMEKSSAKAQAHFALAAKIAEKIGLVQSKLINLGAMSPTQAPPRAPQYSPPQPQQMPTGYPEVPKYQPIAPQGPASSWPKGASTTGDSSPWGAASSGSSTAWQPSAPPSRDASSQGYQPLPQQGSAAQPWKAPATDRSWGGGASGSSSSQPSAPGIPSSYITPGSPLSPKYTPAPANWQVSLEAAQKRVREAEALGQGAVNTAQDKIYEAQERLRGKVPDAGVGRETIWAQRNRMRVTSEEAITEAQKRLRGQDAEMLGYARRVVERYKRGEHVSDEQLEFAFRQLERLTY